MEFADGKWEPQRLVTGGSTSHRTDLVSRLLDTELIGQLGYSWTDNVHLSSTGAPPGGAPFLTGSGEDQASGLSTNFMLRHHFDRFMPILHGIRPFVYGQGSIFSNFTVTGDVVMSGTGLDRALQQRQIRHAFGGGGGVSVPVYCPSGERGGNNCYEFGFFGGVKAVRQELSAFSEEAGNVRSYQNSFYQVVPVGGVMLSTLTYWNWLRLNAMYEVIALNSAALTGSSHFDNIYNFHSTGGLIHNFWFGVSINLQGIICPHIERC